MHTSLELIDEVGTEGVRVSDGSNVESLWLSGAESRTY